MKTKAQPENARLGWCSRRALAVIDHLATSSRELCNFKQQLCRIMITLARKSRALAAQHVHTLARVRTGTCAVQLGGVLEILLHASV